MSQLPIYQPRNIKKEIIAEYTSSTPSASNGTQVNFKFFSCVRSKTIEEEREVKEEDQREEREDDRGPYKDDAMDMLSYWQLARQKADRPLVEIDLQKMRENGDWIKALERWIKREIPRKDQCTIRNLFLDGPEKVNKLVLEVARTLFKDEMKKSQILPIRDADGTFSASGRRNRTRFQFFREERENYLKEILSKVIYDLDRPRIWNNMVKEPINGLSKRKGRK